MMNFHFLIADYLREHHLYEAANALVQFPVEQAAFERFKKRFDTTNKGSHHQDADSKRRKSIQENEDHLALKKRKAESHLIQIHANNEELNKRIESFINVKTQESNESNRLEFIDPSARSDPSNPETESSTTSRVDAATLHRKVQIKTSVVLNQDGPLARTTDLNAVAAASNSDATSGLANNRGGELGYSGFTNPIEYEDGVEERLVNLEHVLRVISAKPIPQDVYTRIKKLEDKIFEMEKEASRLITAGVLPATAQPLLVYPSTQALLKLKDSNSGSPTKNQKNSNSN